MSWAAPTTSDRDHKRLLGALIADFTITSQPQGSEVQVGIRWRSGASEQHTIQRPQLVIDQRRTPPEALKLISRLRPHRNNAVFAAELEAAGACAPLPACRSPRARSARCATTGKSLPAAAGRGRADRQAAADRLGVSCVTIYDWIKDGRLAARRGHLSG